VIEITLRIGGQPLVCELDDDALAAIAAAVASTSEPETLSPFMTIAEAAEFLRCKRQRVDDLLSARRLTRFKDGARTLVSRAELAEYVAASGERRR
jgi:excisionase family DNA binding protein